MSWRRQRITPLGLVACFPELRLFRRKSRPNRKALAESLPVWGLSSNGTENRHKFVHASSDPGCFGKGGGLRAVLAVVQNLAGARSSRASPCSKTGVGSRIASACAYPKKERYRAE